MHKKARLFDLFLFVGNVVFALRKMLPKPAGFRQSLLSLLREPRWYLSLSPFYPLPKRGSFQRMPTILVSHSLVVHVASQKGLHTMAFCNVWHNGNVFSLMGRLCPPRVGEERKRVCVACHYSSFVLACYLFLSFISVTKAQLP
jgi:hypothetical protein